MSTVLLRNPLKAEEISGLQDEFPTYRFAFQEKGRRLTEADWAHIEIVYGDNLSVEELKLAHHLRWVHVPGVDLTNVCVNQIDQTSNLAITYTKSADVHQAGEFVLAAILGHGKNLFEWKANGGDPSSPFTDLMWDVRQKTVVQIGLGPVGSQIASACKALGMKVWGIADPPSFHPMCDKVFSMRELHSLLPAADVVSLVVPRGEAPPIVLKEPQFKLMKSDSILTCVGGTRCIDEEALVDAASSGKFRGVALDCPVHWKSDRKPTIFETPGILFTPQIAHLPPTSSRREFNLFLFNFRRYIYGDFEGMRNTL